MAAAVCSPFASGHHLPSRFVDVTAWQQPPPVHHYHRLMKVGYDTMASWDRTPFAFNERAWTLHDVPAKSISLKSAPRRSVSRYSRSPPQPIELPAPSFQAATSSWSPPPSPGARSRSGTLSSAASSPRSPRADWAKALDLPIASNMSAKEKNQLANKLYAAACAGDLDHVKLLLYIGAPVDSGTLVEGLYEGFKPAKSGPLSPLAGAAGHGQLDAVELLLLHGAALNPNTNRSSSSPLHQAIRANDVEVARFLLELGADVNSLNCFNITPLMYAVKYGSAEMVKLILAFKPNLDQISFLGAGAIHWAIWPDRPEILELLLQAGADKDHAMAGGNTPLHCAAVGGHLATAVCLLRCGADPLSRNEDWKTPLQAAEESNHVEIAILIREAALRRATIWKKEH